MSSVKINSYIRDEVLANVLAHKFAVERSNVAELQGKLQAAKDAREKLGYETVFSADVVKQLTEAPKGWFPKRARALVMVEDVGVRQIEFGVDKPVPYELFADYNHIAAVVSADSAYFDAQKEVDRITSDLNDMQRELATAEYAARNRIIAVLNSVTTTGRLLEVWPEVHQFMPETVSSSSGGLPAEFIGNLNEFLNIHA